MLIQDVHDFHCTSADQFYNKKWAERVRYFKESEEGVRKVCKVMEDMRNETVHSERIRMALSLIQTGALSYDEIAKHTLLTVDEIKELVSDKSA